MYLRGVLPTSRILLSYYTTYFFTLALSVVLYRISPFHPLWRYPGPFWCCTTKFWHAALAATGEQPRYLQRLHDKYGDVVRFGAPVPPSICNACSALTAVVRHHQARTTCPFETPRSSAR